MDDMLTKIESWLRKIRSQKENARDYCELDTIERVIVPLLQFMNLFDDDDPRRLHLVRENRNNKGGNQNWDLNLMDSKSRMRIVIEAKAAYYSFNEGVGFLKRKEEMWEPVFGEVDKIELMKGLLNERKCDCDGGRRQSALESYLVRGCPGNVTRLADLGESVVSELKSMLAQCKAKCRLAELQGSGMARLLLSRLCAKQGNQTNDFYGQVWRYCMDGQHQFDPEHTIPVLTNGAEWIVFKCDFYDHMKTPVIKLSELKEKSDSAYFTYFNMLQENGGFQEKVLELKDYLSKRGVNNELSK